VLDEQERQWQEGYENDMELSHVYINNNLHCRTAAQIIGQKDEEESRHINGVTSGLMQYDDDDDMSISSDESMDLAAIQDGTIGASKPTKLVRKTSGFARFFKKERDTADAS
jgi:hypothetical protein